MRKEKIDTTEMSQPDAKELRFQEKISENKDNHLAGNRVLDDALLRGLIRKSVLRNPRYLLVIRRLRLLAARAAKDKKHTESVSSSLSKNIEHLDPKKIFSN